MPIEDDLRRSLRRSATSASPSADAFERLAARRSAPPSGPSRSSRIASAAVAALVGLGGSALVLQAFNGDNDARNAADPSVTTGALADTSWVLLTIDGELALGDPWFEQETWSTLRFDGDELVAASECNTSTGSFMVDDGTLRTGGGVTTDAACVGSAGQRQDAFFDVVLGSPHVSLEGASMTLATPEHTIEFWQDPCSLLSEDEVADATASDLAGSELVPPFRYRLKPVDGPGCSYDVPGRYTSVGVHVQPTTPAEFQAQRDADPANTSIVEGIGDAAFIHGLASIQVLDGDRMISIGLQHGAGTGAVTVLESLARSAIDDPISERTASADALTISVTLPEDPETQPPVVNARFGDASAPLEAIATVPSGELSSPTVTLPDDVPVGTPIVLENETDYRLRVWNLAPAGPGELVDRAVVHDGELDRFEAAGRVMIAVEYGNSYASGEAGVVVNVVNPS